MGTVLVVHGAWSAAWAWQKMRGRMRELGHELVTPTLTGLGERAHLTGPHVDLDLHIRDIRSVIEVEDLHNIVLLGHSYGGMVATALANRLPSRVAQLVYLDAFVPEDGQCVFDLLPREVATRMREQAAKEGEGWQLAPNPLPSDTSEDDRIWIEPRRVFQPLLTHSQGVKLDPTIPAPSRTYVYCTKIGSVDIFGPFAERARTEAGWRYVEIDASHSPHVTAPDRLAETLQGILG